MWTTLVRLFRCCVSNLIYSRLPTGQHAHACAHACVYGHVSTGAEDGMGWVALCVRPVHRPGWGVLLYLRGYPWCYGNCKCALGARPFLMAPALNFYMVIYWHRPARRPALRIPCRLCVFWGFLVEASARGLKLTCVWPVVSVTVVVAPAAAATIAAVAFAAFPASLATVPKSCLLGWHSSFVALLLLPKTWSLEQISSSRHLF